MTIFVDPYHTTMGMALDMTGVVTHLKECTVRDPLTGTNLGVRPANGIIPVFITGSRDSENSVQSFTHPILIKNFNTKSYLFTDIRTCIKKNAELTNIDSFIRQRELFGFIKNRGIASLAWASGDISRFQVGMTLVSEVFATWISDIIAKTFALSFMDQIKIQLIAYAYYESLYTEGVTVYAQNTDKAMITARKASVAFKVPFTQAMEFYKSLDTPMLSIHDLCQAIVEKLDNVKLNPLPNKPESAFNLRVLLNLISESWYSDNSKPILAISLEHPPTLAAIIYYCMNFNNFQRQKLGQIVQQVSRGGKGQTFNDVFKNMIEEYTQPSMGSLRPVMEYLNESTLSESTGNSEIDALIAALHTNDDDQMNKVKETTESNNFGAEQLNGSGVAIVEGGQTNYGGSDPNSPAPLNPDDVVDGRPIM